MNFDVTSLISLFRESLPAAIPEAMGGLAVALILGILGLLYALWSRIRSRRSRGPNLSEGAKMLLIEASNDAYGQVLISRTLGGASIQTNNKPLADMGDPRLEAKWESAIKDLHKLNLLEARKREQHYTVYALTDEGYKLADHLKQS